MSLVNRLPFIPAPPLRPNTGMLGMGRERARRIHAFHQAGFWLSFLTPVFFFPIVFLMTSDLATAFAAAGGSMAFAVLLTGTVTDLMSMRIPNPLTFLSFVPAFLWWIGLYLGFDAPTPVGFGSAFFDPVLIAPREGALVPEIWTGTLWREIVMSAAVMVLVFLPLLGSFLVGAMGGGDAKFMPPLALFFGWSLGFDFLFLTFLFGGLLAIPMMVVRAICLVLAARPNAGEEVKRIARMETFAYAPAIALAGIVCLAAKWQGIIG